MKSPQSQTFAIPWASMATILGIVAGCSSSVRADLIVDGGFEAPVLPSAGFMVFSTGQTIGGAWTVLGDAGTNVVVIQTAYSEPSNNISHFNSQEGLNSLDITGTFNQGPSAGIEQTVSTVSGQSYTLSFFVGRATPDNGPAPPYATPATVDLSIDGGTRLHFTNSGVTDGRINWEQFTDTFTAAGSSTTIAFLNGTATNNNEAGLDNVTLVATVPEPASFHLVIVGLPAVLIWLRRISRQKS